MYYAIGLVLLISYVISVRTIGQKIAQLSWECWDQRKTDSLSRWMFPFYNLVKGVGEDYFGWAHPFIPIVALHGQFSGTGMGVMHADPSAQQSYMVVASMCWLPKVLLNTFTISVIGLAKLIFNLGKYFFRTLDTALIKLTATKMD